MRSFLQMVWRRWRYRRWLASYDTHDEAALQSFQSAVLAMPLNPLISVLVPIYNTPPAYLTAMIDSVTSQIYPHWELCLVDDASDAPHVRDILKNYARLDARIRVIERPVNGHISAASNTALSMARGGYVALLDHDDVLPAHALAVVVKCINDWPHARLIYSDEDKISASGKRHSPYFKSDWDPELILQQNVFNHLGVFETELVRRVGGFRLGYEGSQDHDLVLRCVREAGDESVLHIPHVLYHWRATKQSTASIVDSKPYAADARIKAVNEHLAAVGRKARAVAPPHKHSFMSVADEPPLALPSVLVLLDAFDDMSQMGACLNSLSKTSYGALHVTVIASRTTKTLPKAMHEVPIFQVHDRAQLAMVANDVVASSEAEYVCLIDARTRFMDPDWLKKLVMQAARPGVGLCGARWCREDGRVLAAGFVQQGNRIVPARPGRRIQDAGYFGLNLLTRRTTTLPGAGIVARRDFFLLVGGLSQSEPGWLDRGASLSRRMARYGMHHLLVAEATLVRSGKTSASAATERVAGDAPAGDDPYYNPNLSLGGGIASFRLASPPRKHIFD